MVGRALLRAALFAALVLALWTRARPASAAPAPFCDDRGATALAAPPALEAPDEAVRRARVSGCERERLVLGVMVRAPHRSAPPPVDDMDKGWLRGSSLPGPAQGEEIVSASPLAPPGTGVRARVERPPRS